MQPHITTIAWKEDALYHNEQTSFLERTELNFTEEMLMLVRELVQVIDDFKHIEPNKIGISATKSKSGTSSGVLAYIIPLRYGEGSPINITQQGGRWYHWAMLPYYYKSSELLYIIYFLLPRFLNLSFEKKIETVVHELLHIHPRFNGDLRRFKGRNHFHYSHSFYEKKTKELVNTFFSSLHNPSVYLFLKSNMKTLLRKYSKITASHFPEPKPQLIKVV